MEFPGRKMRLTEPDVAVMPPPPHRRQQLTDASSSPRVGRSFSEDFAAPVRPTAAPTPFDSSLALTVLLLLAAIFFAGFFSIYIRRFADDSSADRLSRLCFRRRSRRTSSDRQSAKRGGGFDPSAAASLPVFSLRDGELGGSPIDCSVCLAEFRPGENVKAIPFCRHVFHPRCIDTWLGLHLSCPLCRTTRLFPAGNGFCVGDGGCGLIGPAPDPVDVGGGSTGESGDTWTEERRRMGRASSPGMRRASSCSGRRETVPWHRRTASV